MTPHPALRARVRLVGRAAAEALALILPVRCAGCATDGIALCDGCRGALTPHVVRRPVAGFAVHAGLAFTGTRARVVRALKEEGRTGLARPLSGALRAAAASAVAEAAEACGVSPPGGWTVVCVPASRAALRRRGFRVVELLARRAGLRTSPLLMPTRATGDQRGLDRLARARNVAGSLRAGRVQGLSILLIDDVVTTGATLAEARRTLLDAGAAIVAVAALAATPRRDETDASTR